jgi:hypothetical protein
MMRRAMFRLICLFSVIGNVATACSPSNSDGNEGGSAGAAQGGSAGNASGGSLSSGAGGAAGSAAAHGGASSGGSANSGGRIGAGGSGSGGRGISTGGKSAGGASSAGGKSTGGGGKDCAAVQCFRAFECVEKCGGKVVASGCCPCESGTIDRATQCSGNAGAGGEGGASSVDLSRLNESCVDGKCPSGLTPIKFYGIAGPAGPEFCWCSIPCGSSASVCPSGTECVNVADGPGLVCFDN